MKTTWKWEIGRVNNKCLLSVVGVCKARGHEFKLRVKNFRGEVKTTFFTKNVVGFWKVQTEEVMEAGTPITLEKHLDKHLNCQHIEGYRPNASKQINISGCNG